MKAFILLSFLEVTLAFSPREECVLSVNGDLGEPQPLILTKSNEFKNPQDYDRISFNAGEKVKLTCPGTNLQLNIDGNFEPLKTTEFATCINGISFSINGKEVEFNQITCVEYPVSEARETGGTCGKNFSFVDVGFPVEDTFVTLFNICWDRKAQNIVYSNYTCKSSIIGRQIDFERPLWMEDPSFYDVGNNLVNTIYTQKMQQATINSLLGLPENSTKYIDVPVDNYLARGHTTAKADFIFGAQQIATFHLINVAPQWQVFNAKNWEKVEESVRQLAIDRGLQNLKVYTGTYGVLSYPHEETGKNVELYLYNENKKRGIPVPKLYFKYIYDADSQAGIVVLGINNAYLTDPKPYIICSDISNQITWNAWTREDFVNGYIYACSIDKFLKKVPYMPIFDVKGVLV